MKKIFLLFILCFTISGLSYAQWSETSATGITASVRSISVVNDNVVWAAANTGNVLRTTNGGTSWQNVGGGVIGTASVYNIFGLSDQIALCTTSPANTFVYRTTNGGANWTQVFTETGGFINAIWMTSNTNGFMTGDPVSGRWSLWKTTNGGVNWDSTGLYIAQNGAEAGWNNGLYISGSSIWFNTNSVRIYYSSNNGTNWTAQTVPSAASGFGQVWFNSAVNGLASWNTTPLYTSNGGVNWTSGTVPPGTGNIAGIIGGSNSFWIVRNGATGLYKTTNNGLNWTTDYTSPLGGFVHIGLSRSGSAGYAGRTNGQISKNPSLVLGVIPLGGNVPDNFVLNQNYPNPFNPQTTINFSLPKSAFVTLKVYDVLGNEVLNLVNENKIAGNYAVTVDGGTLSSGVYFYTIKAGDFTQTKKMILVK